MTISLSPLLQSAANIQRHRILSTLQVMTVISVDAVIGDILVLLRFKTTEKQKMSCYNNQGWLLCKYKHRLFGIAAIVYG